MSLSHALLTLLILALLTGNIWLSWRVIGDQLSLPAQRAAQLALIWLLPLIGALIVHYLLRDALPAPAGRYKEEGEAQDETPAVARIDYADD